ncbi:MAG: rod shape-determining protein MreC [Coriobacteriia bacterium]|nr:rod shape-determining protein MreC [Coriobacteriia bacterium]MBN2840298.1 rod shape-determining protein MreC [Coriobacteriia bacterium]
MRIGQSEPKQARPTVLIIFVVISLVMLTVYFREGDDGLLHGARRVTLEVTAPIARVGTFITSPIRSIGSFFERVGASQERVQTLEQQNQELRARLAELEEARQENERLRALVDFAEERKFAKLGAEVIRRPVSIWEGVIVIDRGSTDGVEPGMPVIAAQGLIGQIADVSPHSSSVRLVTDQMSGVAAIVQSSRTPGVVRGSVDGSLSLDFIDRASLPVAGDVVLTSGIGGVYPGGIVIGDVVSVDDRHGELYPRIKVASRVPIGSIEEVFVLVGAVVETDAGEVE